MPKNYSADAVQANRIPSTFRHRGNEVDRYYAHGGIAEMMACFDREVLIEGPANTGKTRGVLEKDYSFCTTFPNIRILWVRKTRKSLTESVLTTWEEHVLPPNHPCKQGGAKKAHRDSYEFPNGSVIVLGGMDKPDKVMSSEYDLIRYFEVIEGTIEEWEKLITRLRNKRIYSGVDDEFGRPIFFSQILGDTNPGPAYHFINQRCIDGHCTRIKTTHKDNPRFTAEDQAALDSLTGVRRKRLRDGEWVSAEGQIWEEFNADEMVIQRRSLWWEPEDPENPRVGIEIDSEPELICTWYFGSIDWGHRNAGTLQIWGVDKDSRMYLVGEVYRARKSIDWWAGAIEHCCNKWELERIVADPSRPDLIEYMNDRLGSLAGRSEGDMVIKADNDRGQGIEVVRDGFNDRRLFFCADANELGLCEKCREDFKPKGVLEEIPAYVWRETLNGQYDKEEPDPRNHDHGCDAMRYAAMFAWGSDLAPIHKERMFKPGSWGDVLGHQEVWEAIYRREDALEREGDEFANDDLEDYD